MVEPTGPDGPELVFGLVGPLGTDMDCVVEELSNSLRSVGYTPHLIHITSVLPKVLSAIGDSVKGYLEKINLANEVRKGAGDNSILAGLAVAEIKKIRGEVNQANNVTSISPKTKLSEIPLRNSAYIIRQLKRAEELSLLRKVYGDSFVQISVAVNEAKQFEDVLHIVSVQEPRLPQSERESEARKLIAHDREQLSDDFGQRMLEAYQSADFFVGGEARNTIANGIDRFVKAIFGSNRISPTKDEFGAMLAHSASLRSVDLSRQVGAAIVNSEGDIISLGCNEVPAPGGGQYWGDERDPNRDIELGFDSNKIETSGVVDGFVKLLDRLGALSDNFQDILSSKEYADGLKSSSISDLTEFGRITHAEMSAVTEAARLGRQLSGATMHVTTFPCHNCAKHIVASGVSRIVYIEPYAKSRALQLHKDSLTTDQQDERKVRVEHFRGISPRRFREIFQKGRRKNKVTHKAETWVSGRPEALLFDASQIHTLREISVVDKAFEGLTKCRPSADSHAPTAGQFNDGSSQQAE